MRKTTKKSVDRRIFRKTANRTRAVNVSTGHGLQRGGSRF